MPETSQEVYHCPSCGELAPADRDNGEAMVCTSCGFEFRAPVRISPRAASQPAGLSTGFVQRDVSSRRRHAERVEAVTPAAVLPAIQTTDFSAEGEVAKKKEEVISDDGHKKVVRRMKKRRRTRVAPLLFLGTWAVVVMLLVLYVRNQHRKSAVAGETKEDLAKRELDVKATQMESYLVRELPFCNASLQRFVAAKLPSERAQFVRQPGRLAAIMANYYRRNPRWTPQGRIELEARNMFIRGENAAIETLWKVTPFENKEDEEADDGIGTDSTKPEYHEISFVKEGAEWVLDWEALVRYSSQSWLEFVLKNVEEGEFRLYMRRVAVQSKNEGEVMSVQFFPPRTDALMRSRLSSDRVVIPVDSENGRRATQLFEENEQKPELGDSMFPARNPQGLIRVRVSLYWAASESGKKYLKLRKVLAGNWYGPGFEEDFPEPPEEVKRIGEEDPAETSDGDGSEEEESPPPPEPEENP